MRISTDTRTHALRTLINEQALAEVDGISLEILRECWGRTRMRKADLQSAVLELAKRGEVKIIPISSSCRLQLTELGQRRLQSNQQPLLQRLRGRLEDYRLQHLQHRARSPMQFGRRQDDAAI